MWPNVCPGSVGRRFIRIHISLAATSRRLQLTGLEFGAAFGLAQAQADLSFRLSGAAISLRSSEIAHQNCSHIDNSNCLLLRSLLIVRLACGAFSPGLVHELH